MPHYEFSFFCFLLFFMIIHVFVFEVLLFNDLVDVDEFVSLSNMFYVFLICSHLIHMHWYGKRVHTRNRVYIYTNIWTSIGRYMHVCTYIYVYQCYLYVYTFKLIYIYIHTLSKHSCFLYYFFSCANSMSFLFPLSCLFLFLSFFVSVWLFVWVYFDAFSFYVFLFVYGFVTFLIFMV